MHKDLSLKAHKVQLTQELKPADHQHSRVFANWVLKIHENEPKYHRKIIMSDEAHFHLEGYVKGLYTLVFEKKSGFLRFFF